MTREHDILGIVPTGATARYDVFAFGRGTEAIDALALDRSITEVRIAEQRSTKLR